MFGVLRTFGSLLISSFWGITDSQTFQSHCLHGRSQTQLFNMNDPKNTIRGQNPQCPTKPLTSKFHHKKLEHLIAPRFFHSVRLHWSLKTPSLKPSRPSVTRFQGIFHCRVLPTAADDFSTKGFNWCFAYSSSCFSRPLCTLKRHRHGSFSFFGFLTPLWATLFGSAFSFQSVAKAKMPKNMSSAGWVNELTGWPGEFFCFLHGGWMYAMLVNLSYIFLGIVLGDLFLLSS